MQLTYDPADEAEFLQAIQQIPGYPAGETVPIRRMLFASNALTRFGEVLDDIQVAHSQPLLAVMDASPMRRGPESLKPLVLRELQRAGYEIQPLVLMPDQTGQVHTDMTRIQAVHDRLTPDIAVVSIGSGTITDIAKHACYLFEQDTGHNIPWLCFQTANSVSAYTSNMAPVFVQGVKRTLPSRYPDALVCDLETLRDAPQEMTVAGVGDLLALYSAYPDWLLANHLGMDPTYCEFQRLLLGPVDELLLQHASEIKTPGLEGMAILAKLISLVGLGLSIFHATTSLSGYEHVMSHTLDLIYEASGQPLRLHGSQVALATLLLSSVWQTFLEEFDPEAVDVEKCYPTMDVAQAHIQQSFLPLDPSGRVGTECWNDYQHKLEGWYAAQKSFESFLINWAQVKPALQTLTRTTTQIGELLRATGAPLWFDQLKPPVSEEAIRFAFLNAPLIRRRLTLGDFLVFLDWDRQELLENALEDAWILSAR